MKALAEMAGAAGLDDPRDFLPHHFMKRETTGEMVEGHEAYPYLPEGFLLTSRGEGYGYRERWNRARPDSFSPPE